MTKTKVTKKALASSLLALMLCVSMLLGTTYAWFTDSVTSAGNIIKSGTLDVEMWYADGTKAVPTTYTGEGAWTDASTGAIFNYDLWEPGYTEVRHIQIKNVGTLALKYKVQIVANGTVSDLADVIDVYYMDPAEQIADRTALAAKTPMGTLTAALAGMAATASGNLRAGETDTVTIALKMQESAGNEYQNKSIGTDFSIQLLAAQDTVEADSFDDQYDANAEYPVATQSEFATALSAAASSTGETTIVLSDGDYVIPAGTTISNLTLVGDKNTSVDTVNVASGATLTNLEADGITFTSSNTNDWTGIISYSTLDGATFTNCVFSTKGEERDNNIYGPTLNNVTFDNCTIYGDVYGLNASYVNGTLTVKNCDITGWNSFGGAQNSSYTSNVVIENCTFHKSEYGVLRFYQDATVTNCVFDSNVSAIDCNASGKTISITGCTIKNVTTSETSAVTVNFIHNNGSHTNTWILDGADVSSQVTSW